MRRDGMWDVAKASAWLRQHEWGEDYVLMLIYDTAPGDRLDRWLKIVIAKYAEMYGTCRPLFAPTYGAESWDVDKAADWLRQFPFGPNLMFRLEADPCPERVDHFLGMVSNMHAVIHGYGAPPANFANEESDELFDRDLLQVLSASLIE